MCVGFDSSFRPAAGHEPIRLRDSATVRLTADEFATVSGRTAAGDEGIIEALLARFAEMTRRTPGGISCFVSPQPVVDSVLIGRKVGPYAVTDFAPAELASDGEGVVHGLALFLSRTGEVPLRARSGVACGAAAVAVLLSFIGYEMAKGPSA